MKKKIPPSVVAQGHPDFERLQRIANSLRQSASKNGGLEEVLPAAIRQAIDDVLLTPKTRRWSINDLEKTEKTYLGTRIEIEVRSALSLEFGKELDVLVAGEEADIKFTSQSNWMIPTEAVGRPCILVAADDETDKFYFGLLIARDDYLNKGANKDEKRSIAAQAFENILWIFQGEEYPASFWKQVPQTVIDEIFSGESGNERMFRLFKLLPRTVIARDVIETVAAQRDFMRRLRADGPRGTRHRLGQEGMLLLSGDYDKELIENLALPFCNSGEFVSVLVETERIAKVAASYGKWPVP